MEESRERRDLLEVHQDTIEITIFDNFVQTFLPISSIDHCMPAFCQPLPQDPSVDIIVL